MRSFLGKDRFRKESRIMCLNLIYMYRIIKISKVHLEITILKIQNHDNDPWWAWINLKERKEKKIRHFMIGNHEIYSSCCWWVVVSRRGEGSSEGTAVANYYYYYGSKQDLGLAGLETSWFVMTHRHMASTPVRWTSLRSKPQTGCRHVPVEWDHSVLLWQTCIDHHECDFIFLLSPHVRETPN